MQKNTPILLVGLKKDLRNDHKTIKEAQEFGDAIVSEKEGMEASKAMNCVTYCECSAKTREGLEEVFLNAIAAVLDPQQFIHMSEKQPKKTPKKKGCSLL